MGKIILILGGARSGKSSFAVSRAEKSGKKAAFIATAQAIDKEMRRRIQLHKQNRPKRWPTIEEYTNILSRIEEINQSFEIVILDCLTIYISNLLLQGTDETEIENHIADLVKTLKTANFETLIISNEVGLGIVPNNALSRKFRDLAGKINQITAKQSDEVIFMVSGLPLTIKPSGTSDVLHQKGEKYGKDKKNYL